MHLEPLPRPGFLSIMNRVGPKGVERKDLSLGNEYQSHLSGTRGFTPSRKPRDSARGGPDTEPRKSELLLEGLDLSCQGGGS
jgi:hypothetical protein